MRNKLLVRNALVVLVLVGWMWTACLDAADLEELEFQVRRSGTAFLSKVLDNRLEVPARLAYQFDVWLDPVVRPDGNMQVDPGFAFDLASSEAEPNPHRDPAPKIAVSVREGSDRGFWSLFIDGVNVSARPPDEGNHNNGEYQKPFVFAARPGAYHLRIVRVPTSAEAVMAALDLDHPALAEVKGLHEQGDISGAEAAFLRHMRERRTPPGAPLDSEFLYGRNYREIADQAVQGRYGTKGFFAAFADQFVDPDGTIRWERDNGYLNRHFHWCSLAKAHSETGDPRYAARFSVEVSSWVRNEPFFQPKSHYVGGVDSMDGTEFRVGWMNTSNIGRRFGMEPEAMFVPLERAYRHPMLIARPNRGQVDLNDGGWGTVDDHLRLGAGTPSLANERQLRLCRRFSHARLVGD